MKPHPSEQRTLAEDPGAVGMDGAPSVKLRKGELDAETRNRIRRH